jgi:hypothetical protein
LAYRFIEKFHPPVLGIGSHDGKGPTHRKTRSALEVSEAARGSAGGNTRGGDPQHILIAGISIMG